jgi:Ca2+/Na+ antiporter
MSFSSIIGSLGVSLLLIAFFLNLFRYISRENSTYMLLNIVGAGLSCYASMLIHYLPFIVLEAVWCLVALAAYVKKTTKMG